MSFRLHNSLTRRVEDFQPLDPDGRTVTFYSCGPTVYDYAHIGNFRSFLNADLLRRALELAGYEVRHVMNMTDVGHMTEDDTGDEGEDKMAVASKRLLEAKKSGTLPADAGDIDPGDPYAIADFYCHAFIHDARRLGLTVVIEADDRPELLPRPTRYIEPMIALIETLIDNGSAYVAGDGAVYFDVRSFPDYGQLSGNSLDALREAAGGRIDAAHQAVKKHPADFLLWKPDAQHIMRWPSPWGEGYPGWHLECSVMADALLGKDTGGVIDIHSGGEDNIFPHHECEIAQTRCGSGEQYFARFWFHTRFLTVEGGKMSKSAGNFYTLDDLLQRGASPAAVRLELTKTHYRSNSNFTFQGLRDSQRRVERWHRLEEALRAGNATASASTPLQDAMGEFRAALSDDLNVAGAIGVLDQAIAGYAIDGAATKPDVRELNALRTMLRALGVLGLDRGVSSGDLDESAIDAKLKERTEARSAKDFKTSDRIRDELIEMGIAIKDGPDGTTWTRFVKQ